MKKYKLDDDKVFMSFCSVLAIIIIILGVNINKKLDYLSSVPAVVIHDVTQKETTEPEYGRTVYITPSGKKYHRENCEFLKDKGIAIGIYRALELNFDSCSKCQP